MTPEVPASATDFPSLVDAIRELYRGTPHERLWTVHVRQAATMTAPLWVISLGTRQLCAGDPATLLSTAKLALGLEPL